MVIKVVRIQTEILVSELLQPFLVVFVVQVVKVWVICCCYFCIVIITAVNLCGHFVIVSINIILSWFLLFYIEMFHRINEM